MTAEQLSLLETPSTRTPEVRAVSYLGSKWRVIDFHAAIAAVAPPRGVVCDIFAGSGAVAYLVTDEGQILIGHGHSIVVQFKPGS